MDALKDKFQKINGSRANSSSNFVNCTVPDAWKIPLWVAKLKAKARPPTKRIIYSDRFGLVITVLIVLNAIVVEVTADLELRSALDVYSGGPPIDENATRTLFFAELILTVAFLIELLMRMSALGTRFWTSPDWKFNVLDVVLVTVSAFDVAMQSFTVSFGRLLRLLKVFTTTLRTLHTLHNTIKLRTMMLAILASLGSLVWAVLLLGVITSLFACVLVQGSRSLYVASAHEGNPYVEFVVAHLGSMPMTVLTLWMCVTGEISWWEVEDVLLEMNIFMGLLLIAYVGLMLLALLNIVTDIICPQLHRDGPDEL